MSDQGPKKPSTQEKRAMLSRQKGVSDLKKRTEEANKRTKLVKQEGDRDLKTKLNIDTVIDSALDYLMHLEKALEKGGITKSEVYKLIKNNFESGQSGEATKQISGRLFGGTTYYVKESDKHPKIQGEILDSKIHANFVATEIVDKLKILLEKHNRSEIPPFLDYLQSSIDTNPKWQHFWNERFESANQQVSLKDSLPTLKDMVLGILMYKIIGENEAVALSNMPKVEQSEAVIRRNFIGVMKTDTKTREGKFTPEQPQSSASSAVKSDPSKQVTHSFSRTPKNVSEKVKFFENIIKDEERMTKGKPQTKKP